jgi:hypothetical protein
MVLRWSAEVARRTFVIALGVYSLAATSVTSQQRDASVDRLVAQDGTTFEVARFVVDVPQQRTVSASARQPMIELAVVRVRRVGAPPSRSAHLILAGGPGDSGVDEVLGLVRQGGASFAELVTGDIVGIDQWGTGRSVPNLSSSVLYPLPLDQPGSLEAWLPIIERVSGEKRHACERAALHLRLTTPVRAPRM